MNESHIDYHKSIIMSKLLSLWNGSYVFCFILLLLFSQVLLAQFPVSCASISGRSNGNGQANQCPNNGGPMSGNFIGTPYATVPSNAKTADITFRYANSTTALTPYAITKIYVTTGGVTTLSNNSAGPAGPPTVSGQDVLVKYCIYGSTNLAVAGLLSFELTDTQTGLKKAACTYDASCTSNCATLSNPIVLPLAFIKFDINHTNSSATLQWRTSFDDQAKGFAIEKSYDGYSFNNIGFVAYKLSSGNNASYDFTDNAYTINSVSYYRLKVINEDGAFYYSPVKVLQDFTNTLWLKALAKGKDIIISLEGNSGMVSINIYNYQGQIVHSAKTMGLQYIVHALKTGVYFLSVLSNKGAFETKTVNIF